MSLDTSQTLIISIPRYIYVYQILHFKTQIALWFVPSAAMHMSLRGVHGMSDKQFVYVDRVFLT